MVSSTPVIRRQTSPVSSLIEGVGTVGRRLRRWFAAPCDQPVRASGFEPMEPRQLLSGVDQVVFPGQASDLITVADAPEIQITGNGIVVHDRDPVTSSENLTDFGVVPEGSEPVTHSFTLTNTGTQTLDILNVIAGVSFVASPDYPKTLEPGQSGDLSITMLTDRVGSYLSPVTIYSNAGKEDQFRMILGGTVTSSDEFLTVPEIRVYGDGNPIFNGDTETFIENLTDFGTIDQYSDWVTHTFTISNPGTAPLEILSIVVPDGFELDDDYIRTIEPGGSGEFTVSLDSDNAGFFYDDVVIVSDRPGEETFTFAISGEVTEIGRLQFTSTTPASGRTLIDEQGNTVVFKLAGPGFGTVFFDPETGEILTLELDGTKRTSGLTIDVTKTKGEGTGISSINEVFIEGPLNYFKAGKVDLDGDFLAYGALNSVVMNDIAGEDQQYFFVGGATSTKTSLAFGRISDLVLDISGHISKFTALEWIDTDEALDKLYAGSIGTFNITGRKAAPGVEPLAGDLSADFEIYNTGSPNGRPSVGSIVVAGEVYDSEWVIDGYTASIKLGSVDDLELIAEDGLGSLTVVGEAMEMYVLAGYFLEIGIEDEDDDDEILTLDDDGCGCLPEFVGSAINTVTVGHWIGGELLADSIKSVNIIGTSKTTTEPARPGEAFELLIMVNGQDVPDNGYALGTLNVTGDALFLELIAEGNVNRISLADAELSDFDILGKLNTFTSPGQMLDVVLYVAEGAGTIQAGEWIEGVIEAQTLNFLNITGRGAAGSENKLDGDLLAELIVFGPVQPTGAPTVGTIRVAGTVLGQFHDHEDGDHDHDHGHDEEEHDHEDDHGHEHDHGDVGEYDDHFEDFDWMIRGSVGSVTVGAIDGASLLFDRYYGTKTTTKVNSFKAGTVHDTILDGHGVDFGSISTVNWIEGHIHVNKVGSLTTSGRAKAGSTPAISGDFIAHFVVGDPESGLPLPSGNMLGSMNIAGVLEDSSVTVAGNVGSASFGDVHMSAFTALGSITSLVSKSGIEESVVRAGSKLTTLRAVDVFDSTINANSIGLISVSKDFIAEVIAISTGVSKTTVGIGSLTVGGSILDSKVFTNANVNSVRASAFIDSTLFLGVNEHVSPDQLPTSKLQFTNPNAVLGSFLITGAGHPASEPTFVNSNVAAGVLNNVNIRLVESLLDDEEGVTGFSAASKIGSYRRLKLVEDKTQPVVVTNKTAPGTYDTDGVNYVLVVAEMLDEPAG